MTEINYRSWFARSTHVALTNPTIVNVLGSYYGNVGHGPNQGDTIAFQETANYQMNNTAATSLADQCMENVSPLHVSQCIRF